MTITQQLATLVDSGLTLDDGLSTLVKLAETEKIRFILSDIRKRVHAGTSFADALAEHPDVFSKLYINMVRAGEAGGMIGEALSRLETFLEKSVTLKKQYTIRHGLSDNSIYGRCICRSYSYHFCCPSICETI